jgi:mercuric ion transport protein
MNKLKTRGALGGSALAAITSSLCCIGPLVAGALGAGGFAASALFEKWRPWFLLLTFTLLGWAWYLTYRKPKVACQESASCPAGTASKWNKAVLWLATVFVLVATAFPALSSAFFRGRGPTCCAAVTGGKDGKNQTGVEPSIPKETR